MYSVHVVVLVCVAVGVQCSEPVHVHVLCSRCACSVMGLLAAAALEGLEK